MQWCKIDHGTQATTKPTEYRSATGVGDEVQGVKAHPKSFGLVKIRAKSMKIRAKSPKIWAKMVPNVCRIT